MTRGTDQDSYAEYNARKFDRKAERDRHTRETADRREPRSEIQANADLKRGTGIEVHTETLTDTFIGKLKRFWQRNAE